MEKRSENSPSFGPLLLKGPSEGETRVLPKRGRGMYHSQFAEPAVTNACPRTRLLRSLSLETVEVAVFRIVLAAFRVVLAANIFTVSQAVYAIP